MYDLLILDAIQNIGRPKKKWTVFRVLMILLLTPLALMFIVALFG